MSYRLPSLASDDDDKAAHVRGLARRNEHRGNPLTVARGTALYVSALIGPGLLFLPAVALKTAGPASIVAWVALLAVSAPLAITFADLGVRFPTAEGVSAYARAALGNDAALAIGFCFLLEVILGVPAVAYIGGGYVAALSRGGGGVAAGAAFFMWAAVLAGNVAGLRVSSGCQFVLSGVLIAVLTAAVLTSTPSRVGQNWRPFVPHGWWAVGSATNLLIWLFFGWEAMAQLGGEFRRPHDLGRAVTLTFVVVGALYLGLATATVVATPDHSARAPLAVLLAAGFGRAGKWVAIGVAVALTTGTMNVYTGAAARLADALARRGALPRALIGGEPRDIPRRSLLALTVPISALTLALAAEAVGVNSIVRATSACLIAVYLLSLLAAVRLLKDRPRCRLAAIASLLVISTVAVFSTWYLLVPVAAMIGGVAVERRGATRGVLEV